MDIYARLLTGKSGKVLIADGGSSKMEWLLLEHGRPVCRFELPGVNPAAAGVDALAEAFRETRGRIGCVPGYAAYFGAGCGSEKVCVEVEAALRDTLGVSQAEAGSDLLLAGHLLAAESPSIVCILGTGANSGLFADGKLKQNVASLGYVLGDEGGGAWIGKRILRDVLRSRGDEAVRRRCREIGIDTPSVIEAIYRGPAPARYLGKVCGAMSGLWQESAYLRGIAEEAADTFFSEIVDSYPLRPGMEIAFCGSVGVHLAAILRRHAEVRGLRTGLIVKKPFDVLC